MRRLKVGAHCECPCSHVDDLSFAVDNPKKLIDELTKGPFHFKLEGTGLLNFHLGCGFGRDEDRTLHLDPKQHIEKTLDSFKDVIGESPRKRETPPPPNDHPEMDTSELLEDDDVEKHLSLMGHSNSCDDHVQFSSCAKVGALRKAEEHLWMPQDFSSPKDQAQDGSTGCDCF